MIDINAMFIKESGLFLPQGRRARNCGSKFYLGQYKACARCEEIRFLVNVLVSTFNTAY